MKVNKQMRYIYETVHLFIDTESDSYLKNFQHWRYILVIRLMR